MRYCTHCGAQIADEAVICVSCGCATDKLRIEKANPSTSSSSNSSTLQTIIKILMILSCVASGFCLIPLCWMIPMTVKYFNATKANEPISIEFKVCTLLFVNMIAGILMLCAEDKDLTNDLF